MAQFQLGLTAVTATVPAQRQYISALCQPSSAAPPAALLHWRPGSQDTPLPTSGDFDGFPGPHLRPGGNH
jgi:hypothetical protein